MEDTKDVKFLMEHLVDDSLLNDASMPQENSPPENNLKHFKQGSLVALTQKFLSLIHEGNGVVDLNIVSEKIFEFPSMIGRSTQIYILSFP